MKFKNRELGQIVQLQEKKSRLAEQILGGEEMGPAALSKEALMEILEGAKA